MRLITSSCLIRDKNEKNGLALALSLSLKKALQINVSQLSLLALLVTFAATVNAEEEVIVDELIPIPELEFEVITEEPGDDYVWIGGYWERDPEEWTWTKGHWASHPTKKRIG